MIQLEDEQYQKLVKDADDNKQLVKITRSIIAAIIFLIVYFSYLLPMINIHIDQNRANMEQQINIINAANIQREIESSGLSTEEYFRWLEIQAELENQYGH